MRWFERDDDGDGSSNLAKLCIRGCIKLIQPNPHLYQATSSVSG